MRKNGFLFGFVLSLALIGSYFLSNNLDVDTVLGKVIWHVVTFICSIPTVVLFKIEKLMHVNSEILGQFIYVSLLLIYYPFWGGVMYFFFTKKSFSQRAILVSAIIFLHAFAYWNITAELDSLAEGFKVGLMGN